MRWPCEERVSIVLVGVVRRVLEFECVRWREQETYLPGVTCRAIVRVLFLHSGIYVSDYESFLRAAEDYAAKNDRQRVLRATFRVRQAVERVGATLMCFMYVVRAYVMPVLSASVETLFLR